MGTITLELKNPNDLRISHECDVPGPPGVTLQILYIGSGWKVECERCGAQAFMPADIQPVPPRFIGAVDIPPR